MKTLRGVFALGESISCLLNKLLKEKIMEKNVLASGGTFGARRGTWLKRAFLFIHIRVGDAGKASGVECHEHNFMIF